MFRQPGDDRREARFTRGAVTQRGGLGGTPPATYYDRLTGKSGLSLDQVNELGFDPNHSWLNPEEMNQVTAMERQSMQKLQDQQRNIRPNLNTPAPQPVTDGSTMMSRPDIYRGGQMQPQPGSGFGMPPPQVPMSNRSPGIVPPHLSMGRRDIMPGGGFNPHQRPMPPMGNRFGGGMGGGMRGGMGGGGGMQQFMQFMQTMMQMFQQMQGGGMGGRQGGGYGGGYGGPMRGGYGGGFQNQMRKPYRDTSSPYGGY